MGGGTAGSTSPDDLDAATVTCRLGGEVEVHDGGLPHRVRRVSLYRRDWTKRSGEEASKSRTFLDLSTA